MNRWASLSAAVVLLFMAHPAPAHFDILVSDAPWVERGGTATFTYYAGHPYEVELADREPPEAVTMIDSRGNRTDLKPHVESRKVDYHGEQVSQYSFTCKPVRSGDYIISLHGASEIEEESVWSAYTKLVLHCGRGAGWEQKIGDPVEIVPLTRPYGIRAGSVFSAVVVVDGEPAPGLEIEFEEMNDAVPGEIPPEPLVTGVTRTDSDGQFQVTLDREGWWGLAVSHEGTIEHEGKKKTHLKTAFCWVYIHPGR